MLVGSNPGWVKGYVPTADEWNALWTSKADGADLGTLAALDAAPAGSLTGTELAANVVTSSLTSAAGGSFGTAAFVATGTSGRTVPLLNGANTWSAVQIMSGAVTIAGVTTASGGLKAGTGTIEGSPYTFQSAINFDPSTGPSGSRQNMFNTTLTYATTSTNIWENMSSFVTVNGPGTATGEINGFHSYLQVNSGATVVAFENFEASLVNNGAFGGSIFLSRLTNGAAGTSSGIYGINFNLQNNNVGAGSITDYAAINMEAKSGAGSLPTNYWVIRNAEPNASISTMGPIVLGGLGSASASTGELLHIIGTDNSNNTTVVKVIGLNGQNTLRLVNDNSAVFANGNMSIDALGRIVAPKISASTNLILGSGTALVTSATTGHIFVPSCAGAPTGSVGALGQVALIWDSTDSKLYVGVGGTWKSVVLA